jgi:hypothetical protein
VGGERDTCRCGIPWAYHGYSCGEDRRVPPPPRACVVDDEIASLKAALAAERENAALIAAWPVMRDDDDPLPKGSIYQDDAGTWWAETGINGPTPAATREGAIRAAAALPGEGEER